MILHGCGEQRRVRRRSSPNGDYTGAAAPGQSSPVIEHGNVRGAGIPSCSISSRCFGRPLLPPGPRGKSSVSPTLGDRRPIPAVSSHVIPSLDPSRREPAPPNHFAVEPTPGHAPTSQEVDPFFLVVQEEARLLEERRGLSLVSTHAETMFMHPIRSINIDVGAVRLSIIAKDEAVHLRDHCPPRVPAKRSMFAPIPGRVSTQVTSQTWWPELQVNGHIHRLFLGHRVYHVVIVEESVDRKMVCVAGVQKLMPDSMSIAYERGVGAPCHAWGPQGGSRHTASMPQEFGPNACSQGSSGIHKNIQNREYPQNISKYIKIRCLVSSDTLIYLKLP